MPYQDSLDLTTTMRFLEGLHNVEQGGLSGRKNVSDPRTIDPVLEDGSLRFRFGPENRHQNKQMQLAARIHYGDADITVFRNVIASEKARRASRSSSVVQPSGTFIPGVR